MVTELATMIQAVPAMNIAGAAVHTLGANATASVHADCTIEPATTSWSRLQVLRRRGIWKAARMAPTPMDERRTV